MNPIEHYYKYLDNESFMADPGQAKAMSYLQSLYEKILQQKYLGAAPFWRKWLYSNKAPLKGLYLWGGVGIGKTWLMDIFYECLPAPYRLRLHFHRFMQQVHQQLKALQGHVNPLKKVAQHFAALSPVICFDEFFVSDITDAMLLAGLLQALFEQGVILVATSNVHPDDLYKNGLQRGNFLPAIDLIKKHTESIHVESQMDYRLRTLTQAGIYFYPASIHTEQQLQDIFQRLSRGDATQNEALMIRGRAIQTKQRSNGIIWFEFKDLCNVPRSQLDYIEIAQNYHTVLISHIQQIKKEQDHIIHYLINLIDIFYDSNVTVIISAEVPITDLYTEGRMQFDFQRTQSRLLEMQSEEYLCRGHLSQPQPPFIEMIE